MNSCVERIDAALILSANESFLLVRPLGQPGRDVVLLSAHLADVARLAAKGTDRSVVHRVGDGLGEAGVKELGRTGSALSAVERVQLPDEMNRA